MQRTDFGEMACSIARTLDVIGEPWSPLVLRDVWVGVTRFDQLQADLGISRKVLTERLNHLVEHGVLERRPYDLRPITPAVRSAVSTCAAPTAASRCTQATSR